MDLIRFEVQYKYMVEYMDTGKVVFEWDEKKNAENIRKHSLSFALAQRAFLDSRRVMWFDEGHQTTRSGIFVLDVLMEESPPCALLSEMMVYESLEQDIGE